MKIDFLKNIINQVVCWILLLQMVNISIDPPDLKHQKHNTITYKEDLSINKIESVYEMLAEGIFEVEIPESDEKEIDSSSPSFELYFFNGICTKLQTSVFPIQHYPHYYNNFASLYQKPDFHPPKLA